MPRYLVLEIAEGQTHDLTDFLDDMRQMEKTRLVAEGSQGFPFVIEVKIPAKPFAKRWVTTNGPERHLYVEEDPQ